MQRPTPGTATRLMVISRPIGKVFPRWNDLVSRLVKIDGTGNEGARQCNFFEAPSSFGQVRSGKVSC